LEIRSEAILCGLVEEIVFLEQFLKLKRMLDLYQRTRPWIIPVSECWLSSQPGSCIRSTEPSPPSNTAGSPTRSPRGTANSCQPFPHALFVRHDGYNPEGHQVGRTVRSSQHEECRVLGQRRLCTRGCLSQR